MLVFIESSRAEVISLSSMVKWEWCQEIGCWVCPEGLPLIRLTWLCSVSANSLSLSLSLSLISYYLSVYPSNYGVADPLGSWSSWANHKPSLVSPFFLAFKCYKTDGRTLESKEQHTHVITFFVQHHIVITCYSCGILEERRYSAAKCATISLRT